jgi:hypothetical protein
MKHTVSAAPNTNIINTLPALPVRLPVSGEPSPCLPDALCDLPRHLLFVAPEAAWREAIFERGNP